MKKFLKLGFTVFLLTIFTSSCEEYLDIPPEADIAPEDVFGTYFTFQGFLDQNYDYILDYNGMTITVGHNLTGETIAVQGWNTSAGASTGNKYARRVGAVWY